MKLVSKLRHDILQALKTYLAKNYDNETAIPPSRRKDIEAITSMLEDSDPINIRYNILQYLDKLSYSILAIFPFLEINRFKHSLSQVLHAPSYQEITMLKTLLKEAQSQHLDFRKKNSGDKLEQLELKICQQLKKTSKLDQEINRLQIENKFLCQTIELLTNKTENLQNEKSELMSNIADLEKKQQSLTEKCAGVLQENYHLQQKLKAIQKYLYLKPCKYQPLDTDRKIQAHQFSLFHHQSVLRDIQQNQTRKRRHTIC